MEEVEKANPDIALLLALQGTLLLVLKGVVESKYIDDIWRPVLTVAIDNGLQAVKKRTNELEKELVDKREMWKR